ncbi:MAG TPA: tetratricopeptide repeat protein, partial [Myxococcales bacterium]|nr:tetratricopeptide repeat protein [Myxococcales bacterium]
MSPEIEELPADVKALLAVEQAPLPMPPEVRERLARRVATVSAGVAALSGLAALGQRLVRLLGKRATIALLGFGLGSGAGAEIHAAVVRHRAASARSTPVAPPPAAIPVMPAPVVAPVPEVVAPAPVVHPRERIPEPASTLAAERTLLEIARTALTRGDAAGALAALARHSKVFPKGTLSEERESLRVQALLALGRRDDARAALRQFEAKYPNSL